MKKKKKNERKKERKGKRWGQDKVRKDHVRTSEVARFNQFLSRLTKRPFNGPFKNHANLTYFLKKCASIIYHDIVLKN